MACDILESEVKKWNSRRGFVFLPLLKELTDAGIVSCFPWMTNLYDCHNMFLRCRGLKPQGNTNLSS
jgi:hypothetical protein